ncbi:hypothetical protein NG2371_06976 [Nocardia gamkensis]|nr:hypothetical protein [Nocardia gamkensis]
MPAKTADCQAVGSSRRTSPPDMSGSRAQVGSRGLGDTSQLGAAVAAFRLRIDPATRIALLELAGQLVADPFRAHQQLFENSQLFPRIRYRQSGHVVVDVPRCDLDHPSRRAGHRYKLIGESCGGRRAVDHRAHRGQPVARRYRLGERGSQTGANLLRHRCNAKVEVATVSVVRIDQHDRAVLTGQDTPAAGRLYWGQLRAAALHPTRPEDRDNPRATAETPGPGGEVGRIEQQHRCPAVILIVCLPRSADPHRLASTRRSSFPLSGSTEAVDCLD